MNRIFLCQIGKETEVTYKDFHFIFNDRFGFMKLNKDGSYAKRMGRKFYKVAQEWYDNIYKGVK